MWALIEELGAVVINAITSIATFGLFAGLCVWGFNFWNQSNLHIVVSNAEIALSRDAATADVIFIPSEDIAGTDNTDGHEVDFYRRNAPTLADSYVGEGNFWEWCFRATSTECTGKQPVGTLAAYYYDFNSLPRNGGAAARLTAIAADMSGLTNFSAHDFQGSTHIDNLPEIAPYTTSNPGSCVTTTYDWGYTSVITVVNGAARPTGLVSRTCSVFRVSFTTSNGVVTLPISKIVPSQPQNLLGIATPSPNPMTVAGVSFRNPLATPGPGTVSEPNYGAQPTAAPAQVYTLENPTPGPSQPNGCTGVVTRTPTGRTIDPATGPPYTGDASITFNPTGSAAQSNKSCAIYVVDNMGQIGAMTVTYGTVYQPQSPANFYGLYGGAGQSYDLVVYEQNYDNPPIGGFTAVANPKSVCSITGPNSTTTNSNPSVDTVHQHFTLTFNTYGECTATFSDAYSPAQTATTVASLTAPWPPQVEYPVDGETIPSSKCAKNQPLAMDGSGNALPSSSDPYGTAGAYLQSDANGCLTDRNGNAIDETGATGSPYSIILYEPGATFVPSSTCFTSVTLGTFSNGSGTDGSNPIAMSVHGVKSNAGCNINFNDGTNTAAVQVIVTETGCSSGTPCYTQSSGTLTLPGMPCGSFGDIGGETDCTYYDEITDVYESTDGGYSWTGTPVYGENKTYIYGGSNNIIGPPGTLKDTTTCGTKPASSTYNATFSNGGGWSWGPPWGPPPGELHLPLTGGNGTCS